MTGHDGQSVFVPKINEEEDPLKDIKEMCDKFNEIHQELILYTCHLQALTDLAKAYEREKGYIFA
jgi:hypothetical protein